MRSANRRPIRSHSSSTPALAGAIAAAAFLMGSVAFSIGETRGIGTQPIFAQEAETIAFRPVSDTPRSSSQGTPKSTRARAIDLPDAEPVMPALEPRPVLNRAVTGVPRVVLIIDDVGLDTAAAQRILGFDAPVTLSILPYAEAAADLAAEAQAAGRDVLVHMPMEPIGLADPGPNALLVGLSDDNIRARARWAMARVPGAIGLNNHMGSRFTQDPRALRVALQSVSESHPVFVDSLTTAQSRGAAVARGLGLNVLTRDIFIDHDLRADHIAQRLAEAERYALENGLAVLIGHPHEVTLDALETWLPQAEARGITFASISDLLVDDAATDAAAPILQASVIE